MDEQNRRLIRVRLTASDGISTSCNPLLGKARVTAFTAVSWFSTGAPGENFNAGATSDTLQLGSTDSYTYHGEWSGCV